MAELIAIAYPDETAALEAEQEAQRLAKDLIVQPDAIAAIVRDGEGNFKVTTNHHEPGEGPSWGMFWAPLFGVLFFVPFFGMAVGPGFGALFGKLERSRIDKQFRQQVRDKLAPGTSALFLMVEEVSPARVAAALSRFGGTVITSSLPEDAESELQEALHGERDPVTV